MLERLLALITTYDIIDINLPAAIALTGVSMIAGFIIAERIIKTLDKLADS